MDVMELEEFEEAPGLSTSVEEEGELLEKIRSSATFAWTVCGHVLKKTPEFDAKAGGSINVIVSAPMDKYVNAGIIEPDGTKRYVRGLRCIGDGIEQCLIYKMELVATIPISQIQGGGSSLYNITL